MQKNYSKNGKTLRDYLFEGGIKGKVFVNIHNNKYTPYIVTAIDSQPGTINLRLSEVWECGDQCVGTLSEHLNDPEYNPSKITNQTQNRHTVNRHRFGRELANVFMEEGKREL